MIYVVTEALFSPLFSIDEKAKLPYLSPFSENRGRLPACPPLPSPAPIPKNKTNPRTKETWGRKKKENRDGPEMWGGGDGREEK